MTSKAMTKPSKSADDWISAAFRALTTGGPQAIKAEVLARRLKVSKGSFYWHFKDVADLKSKMLKHWHAMATAAIIDRIEVSDLNPADQLRLLVSIATGRENAPYGGALAESAIRDWGRYDKLAASMVKSVDKQRLGYVHDLFCKHGTPKAQGRTHANILYAALIGLETLAHHGLADLKSDLSELLELLLEHGPLDQPKVPKRP